MAQPFLSNIWENRGRRAGGESKSFQVFWLQGGKEEVTVKAEQDTSRSSILGNELKEQMNSEGKGMMH